MLKIVSNAGYFLGDRSLNGPATIGGSCTLRGAISPNNGLPLTQHAMVRVSRDGFHVSGFDVPDLHFLYSWKCNISKGDFSYQYIEGSLRLLEFVEGTDDFDGFPYDGYPVIFPGIAFSLSKVTDEDRTLISILNDPDGDAGFKFESARASELSIPTHQFGGFPFLLQPNIAGKKCVLCGEEMFLTASIGNECFSNREGFFGNDFVQLLFFTCAPCKVVSAVNLAG